MIAQIGLTICLLGIWLYATTQVGLTRPVRLVWYLVILAGVYFVWLPEQTTQLAQAVGIGRGADLVFYVWLLISFILMLNLHVKFNRNLELLTDLARQMALANPQAPALPEDVGRG